MMRVQAVCLNETLTVGGMQQSLVGLSRIQKVGGKDSLKVGKTLSIDVGERIEMMCGDSKIVMTTNAIYIDSPNTDLLGGKRINIDGRVVNINESVASAASTEGPDEPGEASLQAVDALTGSEGREALEEKSSLSMLDQTVGALRGAGQFAKEGVEGLVDLVKFDHKLGLYSLLREQVSDSYTGFSDAHKQANETLAFMAENPGMVVDGVIDSVVEPYKDAMAGGETGEAIGRGIAEVGSIVIAPSKVAQAANATSKVSEVARAGGIAPLSNKVVSTEFTGKYKGVPVTLKNVEVREISYTRRSRESLDELRRAFDSSARKNYLKSIGNDPEKVTIMKGAGLSDAQISKIAQGGVPKGYNVHHKIPIDDGGTNDFDNLVLIRNSPEHYTITNAQRDLTSHIPYGKTVQVNFPLPPSFLYPLK